MSSDFLGYMSEETHLVGSVTGVIIPLSTIYGRAFSISFLGSVGTLLHACCIGGIEWSTYIVYSPGIFPVVSELAQKVCFNAVTSLTSAVVRWSCEGGPIFTLWS